MPGNILKGTIKIDEAPGNQRVFDNVAKGVQKAATSLQKLPQASNQATQSLTNLGRVVQDAPFGFIGIANNLNPLLEGFQRLKATTGSTGGALKALGSSLLGAGGLGFAVSAVSTLLVLFGDKLFKTSKETDKAAEAAKKYRETIDSIFSSAGKEAAETAGLIGILKSETETRERKLAALKELQKIQPEIFGQLKLEGNAVLGLDAAYQNYLQNLRTVIAVKIKQAQLEQKVTELLRLQGETLTKSEKKFKDANDRVIELGKGKRDLESGRIDKTFFDDIAESADKNQRTIKGDIDQLLKDITELSKGVTVKDAGGGMKKIADNIIDQAKRIAEFLDKNTQFAVNFEIDPRDSEEQQKKAAKEFIRKAAAFFEKNSSEFGTFKLKPLTFIEPVVQVNPAIIKNIQEQTAKEATRTYAQVKKAFEDQIDQLVKNNPIKLPGDEKRNQRIELLNAIGVSVEGLNAPVSLLNDIQKSAINAAQAFSSVLTPAFGDFIGAIVSGKNPIKAFFSSILSAVAQVIQKLAAAAIQALIFNAFLKGNSPGFGTLFKQFAGFRAGGGPVSANQSYIVGEKGPEVFVPNTAGRIIPNNQMGQGRSILGMSQPAMIAGDFRILGKDLVLALALNNAYQKRNA